MSDPDVLDNPVWAALVGPHASFARAAGAARRYADDVAVFAAVPTAPDAAAWHDLRSLVPAGVRVAVFGPIALGAAAPLGWTLSLQMTGVQMVAGDALRPEPDDEAVRLGGADVHEMLDLVARTDAGPFLPRTVELGTYLGIRRAGRLVAMAGERMHPPGLTEISAVCTDPSARGSGLAARLVRAVAHGVVDRGETPFLHVTSTNTSAVRLYDRLGFERRREITISVITPA